MILGITGKYCSGKNLVTKIFVDYGWYEVDMDALGHIALNQNVQKLSALFGKGILDENGSIDRKKLGKIVFRDKNKLLLLESVVHPQMVVLAREIIGKKKGENIVINAAILHKMGLNKLCDAVLWVKAPLLGRFRRAVRRDSHSFFQIIKRMISQRLLDAKYYQEDVDSYTIWNRSSIDNLKLEVKRHLAVLGEKK